MLTFHAFGARLLRRHADRPGLDPGLRHLRRERREAPGATPAGPARSRPGALQGREGPGRGGAGQALPQGRTSGLLWEDAGGRLRPLPGPPARRANAFDFSDLIYQVNRLFDRFPEVREDQPPLPHVLVDEFQDTNPAQYRILKLLCPPAQSGPICVVGDDDQSIYGWRGAHARNILGFAHDFPGCRVVKLEQNYRSTGHILQAAHAVVAASPPPPEEAVDRARWPASRSAALPRGRARRGRRWWSRRCGTAGTRACRSRVRRLLPHQRPEPGAGGAASLRRHPLRADRRDAVLRAERGKGRPLLPAGDCEPQGMSRRSCASSISRGGGSATLPGAAEPVVTGRGGGVFEAFARTRGDRGGKCRDPVRAGAGVPWAHLNRDRPFQTAREAGGAALAELFKRVGIEEELFRTIDDPKVAARRMENVEQIVNSLAGYEERALNPTLSGFLEKVSLMDARTASPTGTRRSTARMR